MGLVYDIKQLTIIQTSLNMTPRSTNEPWQRSHPVTMAVALMVAQIQHICNKKKGLNS